MGIVIQAVQNKIVTEWGKQLLELLVYLAQKSNEINLTFKIQ